MNLQTISPKQIHTPQSFLKFKALHKNTREYSIQKGILDHTTLFFRYSIYNDKADEFIFENYLKNKKGPINILSAGCSYGEEAYSYAMLCEKYGINANIEGIDFSKQAINGAKKAQYELDLSELEYILFAQPKENSFQEKAQQGFEENFENLKNEDYCFKLKKNRLKNCKFKKRDLTTLNKSYKANSQDLILCRYVLYHLDDNDFNKAIDNFYYILKPNGLLCLNKNEYQDYERSLFLKGFIQPYQDYPHIFQKPSVFYYHKLIQ